MLSELHGAVGTSRAGGEHEQMDITDRSSVLEVIERVRPAWVINTAAMTSVDGCEKEPEAARTIHVDGTQYLLDACQSAGSRLLHLSTNYVFDGEDGPYGEDDPPNPLGVYGQTKLDSERLVTESDVEGVVVRTAVFYGPEHGKPNFVTWALRELAQGKRIRIVTDEWANPTGIDDLGRALAALTRAEDLQSCYHGAGPDYFSRYEMVTELCDVFGLDADLVEPVQSKDLGQAAARPNRAGLKTDRIVSQVGAVFRPYRENLESLRESIPDLEEWARKAR